MTEHILRSLSPEVSQINLQLKGKIPSWLKGTLIRNGPAKFNLDGQKVFHWFDGLAMLHAFSFDEGKVSYTSRYLRTDAYRKVFSEGSMDYIGFANDPCRSLFRKLFTAFFHAGEQVPNANINVAKFCGQYVALTEIPLPVQFDHETLATVGVFNYTDSLPKQNIWNSAHPHVGSEEKTLNYYLEFGRHSHYVVYKMSQKEACREVIAKIPTAYPSYMHSFAVTANFVILVEYPLVVNPLDLLLRNRGFIQNYHWKPELKTRFTIVEKSTGEVLNTAYEEPCFAFHHVNAYERDRNLYLDLIAYPDAEIVTALGTYGEGFSEAKLPLPNLIRFKVSLDDFSVTRKTLSKLTCELPRIHPSYDGQPYRYLYAADLRELVPSGDLRHIYKIDVETGETIAWGEEGGYPGEPVFIPTPDGLKEDEGVVLAVVLSERLGHSFLIILDGSTLKEVGRAELPHQVAMGLHGQFFSPRV